MKKKLKVAVQVYVKVSNEAQRQARNWQEFEERQDSYAPVLLQRVKKQDSETVKSAYAQAAQLGAFSL